jgi:predicted NodU family carbamoyl transferase
MDQVAHALARKFAWRIQPDGATAQNLLGLSTQVPARIVYLSDGPDRSYTVGKSLLDFQHTALKEAGFKLPESRLLVQALKAYGENRITRKIIAKVRKKYDSALRQRILVDTKTATGWVDAAIQEIAKEA